MKKVLLLNPPSEKKYARDKYCTSLCKGSYYWPPIDLIVMSGILSSEFDVEVIDAVVENIGFSNCFKKIKKRNFDIIISLVSCATLKKDMKFLSQVRVETNAQILLSGGVLLFEPKSFMEEYPFIDAILLDFTSRDILKYLQGEIAFSAAVVTQASPGKKFFLNRDVQGDFNIGIPCHEKFLLDKYDLPWSKKSPLISTITSFGCVHQCSFCVASNIPFRQRDFQELAQELEHIQKIGGREIHFADYSFGLDKAYLLRLCTLMLEKKYLFSWSCQTRADLVDEDSLRLMKASGCHTVQFGVESGDDQALTEMNKGLGREDISNAFELCKKVGIDADAFFVIGFPKDDELSINSTLEFAKKLGPDLVSFSILMPHRTTRIYQELKEKNLLVGDEREYDDWHNVVVRTENMTTKELVRAHRKTILAYYLSFAYLVTKMAKIKTVKDLSRILRNSFQLIKNIF